MRCDGHAWPQHRKPLQCVTIEWQYVHYTQINDILIPMLTAALECLMSLLFVPTAVRTWLDQPEEPMFSATQPISVDILL